ncbi:MAG: WYL domain-containing protein [Gammaproteobacteria bacterium]|nr:WYL domain-containing protein [Gammaproteobacteria bacterium]
MQGDTLERQWRLLRAIPSHPKVMTVSELLAYLTNTAVGAGGKGLTARTLERDIVALQSVFGATLRIDRTAKPYRVSWAGAGHPDGRVRLTEAQAVAFVLLEASDGDVLPPTLKQGLRPFFTEARGLLAQGPASLVNGWPQKLRVWERRRPGASPEIAPVILQTVCEALFQGRTLTVDYQGVGASAATEYRLHLLGLVRAHGVYYLAATAWEYEDVRHYALHRMSRVLMGEKTGRRPKDFDLDAHIASGAFDIPFEESPMTLVLRVSAAALRYLREAPLAPDQIVRSGEPWSVVQARVMDSHALRTWLLGQGAELHVVKPLRLRRWMGETLRQASAAYNEEAGDRDP